MKKAEGAKTARELKEKYSRKRYTPRNLGIAFVAEYLYGLFLYNEGVSYKEQFDKKLLLFSETARRNHAHILSELEGLEKAIYNRYYNMLSESRTKFQFAVQVRDATIMDYLGRTYLINDTLAAEEVITKSREKGIYPEATEDFTNTLSAESFKKGRQRYKALNIFKQDIEKNLKYIQMHNTYIELIAEAFKIPEMEVLKVSTNSIDRQFEIANNHTKELREEEKAKAPSSQVKVYFDPVFDIQPAPPISEELTSLLLSDLKKYLSVIDCYNNLLNCYLNGQGIEAYSYG
jgi:hypothetical protein